ncbi:hypothetical protein [Gilvimarinus polysaccharolyticus]|uniref:hypothetical protein n=1 Tax=Gilvimarinus polysaccharolyticus TaxID=863921 RepID=UPI0012F71BB0|nr:hypothetical protein [Gilvimarinus polysaccharolyticus]
MLKVGLSSLGILMLVGCASNLTKTPELAVSDRAQTRVDALMMGDYEKAYKFTTPGYRSSFPLNRYKSSYLGASGWTFAKVNNVQCDESVCNVTIDIRYKSAYASGEIASQLTEKWISIDDKWWLYLK